jgi:hypothetical protein
MNGRQMKPTTRNIALALGAVLILGGGIAFQNRYAVEHFVMSRMHSENGQHMGGMGMGHMFKGVDTTEAEEAELRAMFENHPGITRTVENLPNGIRTVTAAADEDLRNALISHAVGMIDRVDQGRDPKVFIQSPTLDVLFRNRALITTEIDTTDDGIIVTQTSDDAETVAALQKHAAEVSDLAARGMQSVHESMSQRMN